MLLYLLFMIVYIPDLVLSNEPVIIPFSIPSDLIQGGKIKLMCSVSKGQHPLKFEWLFNGHSLVETSDLFLQNLDDASILNIKNLKLIHNGKYECIVNNKFGRDVYTATLSINAPPHFIKKPPEFLTIKEAESISIDCIADGYPKIKTIWSKAFKNSNDNLITEQISNTLKAMPNGTLHLENMQKSDEGEYICTVDNSIGEKLISKTKITIQTPAKVSMIDNNGKEIVSSNEIPVNFAKKDESFSIRCLGIGDPPIYIDWLKDGKIMQYKYSSNMETINSLTISGLISELHFKKIVREDSSVYECRIKNDLNESKKSLKLIVLEIPEAPKNLQISELTSDSVKLNWHLGYNGNLDLIKINIYYWETSNKLNKINNKLNKIEIDLTTSTWHILKGLKSGVLYSVAVTSVNKLGESALSETVKFETKLKNPVNPPTDLMVKKIFGNKVAISWKYSRQDFKLANLTGFQVFYKPIDEQNYYIERMAIRGDELNSNDDKLHLTLVNLKKNTKYLIKVKAYNKEGYSPDSEEIECLTLKGNLPNPPKITQHQIHSKSYLIVKWEYIHKLKNPTLNAALKHQEDELNSINNEHQQLAVPKNEDNNLQDFDESVQFFMAYVELSELHMIVQTIPIASNYHQVTIANLDKDVEYNIYISANNNYGESEFSDPLIITIRSYQYEMNLFMAEKNALIVTAISIGSAAILVSIICSIIYMKRFQLAQQEKLRKMSTLTLSKFGTNKTTATYATIGTNAPTNLNPLISNFQNAQQHAQLTPINVNTNYLNQQQPTTSGYQEIGLAYDLATGLTHVQTNLNQQQKTPRHQPLSTFGHVTIRSSDSNTESEDLHPINIKDRLRQSNKSLDSMKNMRNYDECIYDDALG